MPVRKAVVAVAAALLVLLTAGPAIAQDGEQIRSYDVTLDLDARGVLRVEEVISYDFGRNDRHGIFRQIPVRLQWDETRDRVWRVDDVEVSSDAPDDVEQTTDDGVLTLRIGDPDQTVTGVHTYRITYTVEGAAMRFADQDELNWNAVGDQWEVPVQKAAVTIRTPAEVTRTTCYAGYYGSTEPCDSDTATGSTASFAQRGLAPRQGLTTVVAMPRGSVAEPGPILVERQTLARAFRPGPAQLGIAAAVLLLGVILLGRLGWRIARDRRFVGTTPGFEPAPGQPVIEEAKPLRTPDAPVQFTPPRGMAPGVAGTLLDERAEPLDVSATIVDLAVRGHLRITELERPHLFASRDWQLEQLSASDDELRPYEADLLAGLFRIGPVVRLSELKERFHLDMDSAQRALNAECVRNGWFRGDPRTVRSTAMLASFVAIALAGAALWVLGMFTTFGLVGVALLVVAIGLFAMSGSMPSRTGKGTAALEQLTGFRLYLATAEADRLRHEETTQTFARYLPWAMVFGETERWARVLGALAEREGVALSTPWYGGPPGWNPVYLADSLGGFAAQSAAVLSARPAPKGSGFSGGGGGFSGGGGGGGGGGSW